MTTTTLFNGRDLDGWFAIPRVYSPMWPGGPTIEEWGADQPEDQRFDPAFLAASHHRQAQWSVEDGVIVGRQDAEAGGFGGFLLTERTFTDFELTLEVDLDWPADSGVLVRKTPSTWNGIQILLDHRRSGSIGGFYGNGIGAFHAVAFNLDAELDDQGRVLRLVEEDPAASIEPLDGKADLLSHAASGDEFLAAWKPGDWNEIRVRVVGRKPTVTTWINGVLIAEIDLATLDAPHYDGEAVADLLGRAGHIALEVHDTDPMLGAERWGSGSRCRWRGISVVELPETDA